MKFYPTGEDLAKDMGVPLQTLIDTHQKHFEAAKKQEQYVEIWKNGLRFVNVYHSNSCFKRRLLGWLAVTVAVWVRIKSEK